MPMGTAGECATSQTGSRLVSCLLQPVCYSYAIRMPDGPYPFVGFTTISSSSKAAAVAEQWHCCHAVNLNGPTTRFDVQHTPLPNFHVHLWLAKRGPACQQPTELSATLPSSYNSIPSLFRSGNPTTAYHPCFGLVTLQRNDNVLQVYYLYRRPIHAQSTLPTWVGAFRLLRLICLREQITLVHCHQAFSTLGGEALLQARTMGYKVRSRTAGAFICIMASSPPAAVYIIRQYWYRTAYRAISMTSTGDSSRCC